MILFSILFYLNERREKEINIILIIFNKKNLNKGIQCFFFRGNDLVNWIPSQIYPYCNTPYCEFKKKIKSTLNKREFNIAPWYSISETQKLSKDIHFLYPNIKSTLSWENVKITLEPSGSLKYTKKLKLTTVSWKKVKSVLNERKFKVAPWYSISGSQKCPPQTKKCTLQLMNHKPSALNPWKIHQKHSYKSPYKQKFNFTLTKRKIEKPLQTNKKSKRSMTTTSNPHNNYIKYLSKKSI